MKDEEHWSDSYSVNKICWLTAPASLNDHLTAFCQSFQEFLRRGKTVTICLLEKRSRERIYIPLIILIVACSKSCKTSGAIKEAIRSLEAAWDNKEKRKNMSLYITKKAFDTFQVCDY